MAFVVPFGDMNAHGKLNNSLQFKRWRNKSLLTSKTNSKKSNSPDQVKQREVFEDAIRKSGLLYFETKEFYRKRGAEYNLSWRCLFIKKKLKKLDPKPINKKNVKDVENMVLYDSVGDESNNLEVSIEFKENGGSDYSSYGLVEDNSNIFTKEDTAVDPAQMRIKIVERYGSDITIPFRYLVAVHWKDFADVEHVSNLRLPDLDFEPGLGYYLQMSNDWSTWWDDPMRRLACTDRI